MFGSTSVYRQISRYSGASFIVVQKRNIGLASYIGVEGIRRKKKPGGDSN